jgi:uncharacterized protein YgiB involved in biofilm formation
MVMHAELQCQHDNCRVTSNCVDLFNGANKERGWTWWRHADLITCPAHYADGEAMERQAERDSHA